MRMTLEISNNYSVYRHIFPNGKSYIGITSQPLKKRFENGRGYKRCPKMHNAILKYGWNNIEHELLYSGLSKEEAEAKEIELIAFYGSVENGYNIDHGGNTTGTHSIETRNKISIANKGIKKPPCSEERKAMLSEYFSGERNPFYGKHHSEKVKEEHSKFMKGNQYNKGNHHTEEFKRFKSAQMKEKYSNGGNPKCKAVIRTDSIGNVTRFYSLQNAAQTVGKNVSSLHNAIKKHSFYCGYYWEYENESRS